MARILLAYHSHTGQTQRIADVIASEAEALGHDVDRLDVSSYEEPGAFEEYDGFIVGGPIYRTRHSPSLATFVINHLDLLESRPSAFFSVSLSAAAETEEDRVDADLWAQRFMHDTHWHPEVFDTIGGALMYSKYSPVIKQVMRGIAWFENAPTDTSRDYDLTDWDGVRTFAHDVVQLVATKVPPEPQSLLDQQLPFYDASVIREQIIPGSQEETWRAMLDTDLTDDALVNALSELRVLPDRILEAVTGDPAPELVPERLTFGMLLEAGNEDSFRAIAVQEPRELLFGAIGRVWKPAIEWHEFEPEEFADYDEPGVAKIGISLRLEPVEGGTRVVYEARTATTDDHARRRFKLYWKVIGRFAGFVMGRALDMVARTLEASRQESGSE